MSEAPWTEAYLGLGANLGHPEENIRTALKKLDFLPTIQVIRVSALYRTAPVGMTAQLDFVNAAAAIITTLEPEALLVQILQIECEMGRVRTERWGPRTIDIDLLVFGQQNIDVPGLCVPHPRLKERAFALVPLAEIAPDLILPGESENIKNFAETVKKPGTFVTVLSSENLTQKHL